MTLPSKDKIELEEVVNRLTNENTKHRETIEAIQTLLRIRAGSITETLKPIEGIRAILEERDTLNKKVEFLTEALLKIRSYVTDNRIKDAVEWFRKHYNSSSIK